MFDTLNLSESIRKAYATVTNYAKEAATCVDPTIIRKRFMKWVPNKTPGADSRHWGRDKWIALDSLPRSYRDMVQDDPQGPDGALEAATELWQADIEAAEKAMDLILRYEKSLDLDSWLTGAKSEEIQLIEELMAARLRLEEDLKVQQQEKRKNYQKPDDRDRTITLPSMTIRRERFDAWIAAKRNVQVVKIPNLPPHKLRELGYIKPVIKVSTCTVAARTIIVNDAKQADKSDRTPPLKIHPNHVKRGRNY